MSKIPSPDPSQNDKPIPKEAMKFLKMSPSVKVMSLKKSSVSSLRPPQVGLGNNNSLAGGSNRTTESGSEEVRINMKPLQKDKKMISVLSAKSGKEARKQFLERSAIGERRNCWRDVENVNEKSDPKDKPKHWYGRWLDALLPGEK